MRSISAALIVPAIGIWPGRNGPAPVLTVPLMASSASRTRHPGDQRARSITATRISRPAFVSTRPFSAMRAMSQRAFSSVR